MWINLENITQSKQSQTQWSDAGVGFHFYETARTETEVARWLPGAGGRQEWGETAEGVRRFLWGK